MTEQNRVENDRIQVMDAMEMGVSIISIAREIVEANPVLDKVALMGILRRGRPLADRIAAHIAGLTGVTLPVGSLSTEFYRDDLRSGRIGGVTGATATHFGFDIDSMTLVLVDDVIAAGRTVRAALDELMDYGRPAKVRLACLVDRGWRELPIRPDFLGRSISSGQGDHVAVHLIETDGEDSVCLEPGEASRLGRMD